MTKVYSVWIPLLWAFQAACVQRVSYRGTRHYIAILHDIDFCGRLHSGAAYDSTAQYHASDTALEVLPAEGLGSFGPVMCVYHVSTTARFA